MRQPIALLRRTARLALAATAIAVTALGGAWIVDAARAQHAAAARAERAASLHRVIALARDERRLLASAPSAARSLRLGSTSAELVEALEAVRSDLGTVRRPDTREKVEAIDSAARRALAREQLEAIAAPTARLVPTVLVLAALLAAIQGPLLLFWAIRRHRRRIETRHEARMSLLATQARTDTLTRLGNRRAFEDDLSQAIAQRSGTGHGFALMAIDLDGLKRINDTNGHPAGDAHIRLVAECIQSVVQDHGSVYRTGGDEFMVILPGRRNWHGQNLAAQIDRLTQQQTGSRSVSIGLTESLGQESRNLLINQVDVALYEAKRTRLNAVAFHPGLRPTHDELDEDRPSHEQRALAAALARAVDAKDAGTRSHSETVAQFCVAIGQQLGITGPDLERLRLAGLLHDVGKIGVADAILQKPETLAPDEHSAMTEHVEIGHAILLAAELPIEAHWILHHHERADGAGYPSGLRGDSTPIQSRIIAVADAFEAMTGSRPYRDPISVDEAIAELEENADTQFDVQCVEALVEVVRGAATEEELVGLTHGGSAPVVLVPRSQRLAEPVTI